MIATKRACLVPIIIISCVLLFYYKSWKKASSSLISQTATVPPPLPPVVLLVSQCFSGSYMISQMFNYAPNVTYLHQPLFPFRTADCGPPLEPLRAKSLELLSEISRCNFDSLVSKYSQALMSGYQLDFAGCLINNLCYAQVWPFYGGDFRPGFIREHVDLIDSRSGIVDLDALTKFCRRSNLIAASLYYLTEIEDLRAHAPSSASVVHVVRDARGMVFSHILSSKKSVRDMRFVRSISRTICTRLLTNVKYGNKLEENFLRIRYEQFLLAPFQVLEDVYKFIDKPPPVEFREWFESDHEIEDKKIGNLEVTKDANQWRNELFFREVKEIQSICGQVLKLLGYRKFENAKELNDLKIPSFY